MNLTEFFSSQFDVPLEGISDIPSAQLIGNSILNIDGCTGIKKYETSEIIISSKKYLLCIKGKELSMLAFSGGRVTIRGIIESYIINENKR